MMENLEAQIRDLQEQYDAEYARLLQWQKEIRAKGNYYNSEQDNSIVEKANFMEAVRELEKLKQHIYNLKEQAKWQNLLAFKPSEIKASERVIEIISSLQARIKAIDMR